VDPVVAGLLESPEPSIRLKTLLEVVGAPEDSPEVLAAREQVRSSDRVSLLLSRRGVDGRIPTNPYQKWCGAHWTLAMLAEVGYPPGDESLAPLREQVYEWILSEAHLASVHVIDGRARRCGSQEGYAAWALIMLGLDDDRTVALVNNLLGWQWPDGGWNCDRRPEADTSSFHETWLPMRALSLVARRYGCTACAEGARRAAEVFLKRGLFRRASDGEVIDQRFLRLAWPPYWRYSILAGLSVLAEAGFVNDERCAEALDVLESRRLPDGGWQADERLYKVLEPGGKLYMQMSPVDWGPIGRRRMNEWVTVEALSVLRVAGRFGC